MHVIPELSALPSDNQPPVVEMKMADGVFIKQMLIETAGTYIPQHSHSYDHTSMLAVGSVRLWKDGLWVGDFIAPAGITIVAGVSHTFMALEDMTIVYCIHNVIRSGEVDIMELKEAF